MSIFRLLYSRQYFPDISLALSLAVLPLYFVRYIHGSATLIFRMLYPWLYEVLTQKTAKTSRQKLGNKLYRQLVDGRRFKGQHRETLS